MAKFCTAVHSIGRLRQGYGINRVMQDYLLNETYLVFTDELTDLGREIVDKFCSFWRTERSYYISSYCWEALLNGDNEFVKIYGAENLSSTCLDTQVSKVKAAGKEFADFVIKTEAA